MVHEEVQKQLLKGIQIESVKVDLRLSVMKELEAKWIVSTFDYLRANTSIVFNGFQEAGIVHAIQNGPQVLIERGVERDNDAFAGLDSDYL